MIAIHRLRSPAPWPFWLLLAAWVCANTPAVAFFALLTWLGEARHFDHQQRIMIDVAFVLSGQDAPGRGLIAAAKNAPTNTSLPTVPAEVSLKKIDLAVERTAEILPPEITTRTFSAFDDLMLDARREPPPHEPPREWIVT
jgi:hypothetical protein